MTRPLRIAALAKQIPKFEAMALGPDGRLQREGMSLHMSDYCRRAVAQGHALARAGGGTLTVFTLGPPSAEQVLREAIAFGADDGVLITDPAFAASDTLATSRALAAALAMFDFDLILAGRNSMDAETGQVPAQLAALLDRPFAAGVRTLELDGDTLRLRLEHDDAWVQAEVELPALISCAERLCEPCKVSDADALAAVDPARIRRITAAELGAGPWGQAGSPTSVGEVRTLAHDRSGRVMADGSVDDKIAAVLRVLIERGALDARADAAPAEPLPEHGTSGGPEIVVVIEPDRPRIGRELLGAAAQLAASINGEVVAFAPALRSAEKLAAWGADRVVGVEYAGAGPDLIERTPVEEDVAAALAAYCRNSPPWAVLGPGTLAGREVLGRASALLGAGMTGDAIGLDVRDGRLIAAKPAFGGQLVADIACASPIQCVTVRPGVLSRPEPRPARPIEATTQRIEPRSRLRVTARGREDDIEDLLAAPVVLGVGAGVDPDDYPLVQAVAKQLGAQVCATRRVTDRGWQPRARQVGITGHAIAPRLYVLLGASGKFNHMIAVRAAGTVLAVNTDPSAFGFADIGIVGDWKIVLPALADAITSADKPN